MAKELTISLGQTGLTVTANVYLLGVLKASGISCAEIGVTGAYAGDFSAAPNVAGVYDVEFFVGAATVSSGGGQIVWDGAAEVVQTGDNFARIGAAGAGLTALGDTRIANLDATISSRVKPADTLARVTLVDTTTTLTNAPSVPSAASIADAVWDEAIAGHLTAGTTGAKLNSLAAAAGSGAIAWDYTLTNSITGLPIADADVWVTSDSAGLNVLASGRTNASGVVSFMLDAGTVYVFRQKSGWNFTNPDTETVS